MILRTSANSTVASCALTPLGTFKPADRQLVRVQSALASCEVSRNDEEAAGEAAEADDDGGTDLAAAQVRERNGQQDNVIA